MKFSLKLNSFKKTRRLLRNGQKSRKNAQEANGWRLKVEKERADTVIVLRGWKLWRRWISRAHGEPAVGWRARAQPAHRAVAAEVRARVVGLFLAPFFIHSWILNYFLNNFCFFFSNVFLSFNLMKLTLIWSWLNQVPTTRRGGFEVKEERNGGEIGQGDCPYRQTEMADRWDTRPGRSGGR